VAHMNRAAKNSPNVESYDRAIERQASRIARSPGTTANDRIEFSERVSRTGRELGDYILDKRVKLK